MSDPSITPDTSPAPPPTPPLALAREVALGALGYVALGLCAGLGAGDAAVTARATPSVLVGGLAALVLSTPALVVVHEFLGLPASPDTLVRGVAGAFGSGGRVALGLVPVMLFTSATTGLAGVVLAVLLLGVALLCAVHAVNALVEADGADSYAGLGLALAWTTLTGLVTLRIAFDLTLYVLA